MPKKYAQRSKASAEFLNVLGSAPPAHELPWMRVEIVTETNRTYVFGLAVHEGWVVAGAPIGRRHIGQRARAVWKLLRNRGAVLSRLDPAEARDEDLLLIRR